jgi:hypothetical protein
MHRVIVRSSNVSSIAYEETTKTLEVVFKSGGVTKYLGIPKSLYHSFLVAPSKGRFVHSHLANRYESSAPAFSVGGPSDSSPVLPTEIKNSWARNIDYLPKEAHGFVKSLLEENPAHVVPVSVRRSKHGDYHRRPRAGFHKITINKCGNPYQFLVTLIHEVAHARAYKDYGTRIRPHGHEWRTTFSAFLHRSIAAKCYPEDIISAVQMFAFSPTATTTHYLEKVLRKYDKLDQRPLVLELPPGSLFSLRNGLILQKGELRQKHFRCKSREGTVYRVSVQARVYATHRDNAGTIELICDYQALTRKLFEDFEEYDLWNGYIDVPEVTWEDQDKGDSEAPVVE